MSVVHSTVIKTVVAGLPVSATTTGGGGVIRRVRAVRCSTALRSNGRVLPSIPDCNYEWC